MNLRVATYQFVKLSCQTLNQRFELPNGQNKRRSAVLCFTFPDWAESQSPFSFSFWDLSSLKLSPVFWEHTRNRPSTQPGGWKPVHDFLMMSELLPSESLYISWKWKKQETLRMVIAFCQQMGAATWREELGMICWQSYMSQIYDRINIILWKAQ